jgi:hypothetical protein
MLPECSCGFYSLCCGHVMCMGGKGVMYVGMFRLGRKKWDYSFLCVYPSIVMLS